MTPSALLQRYRLDMGDTAEPYLWSDAEIQAYAEAAQTELCAPSRAGGIRDSSSVVTQIVVTEGEPLAPISPLIQRIRGARLESSGNAISVLNFSDVWPSQGTVRAAPLPFALSTINQPGPLIAIITDVEDDSVQLVHIPQGDDTILLTVERFPLNDFFVAPVDPQEEGELEVAARHHETLLLWMRTLGYRKQDADTFDQGKADEYEARFNVKCEEAAREKRLREHKPRLIQYGGL